MDWELYLTVTLRVAALAWGALVVWRSKDVRTALLLPLLVWVLFLQARNLFLPGPHDTNLSTSIILILTLFAVDRTLIQAYRKARAFEQAQDRHQVLIDSLPLCVHELDLSGRLIAINQAGLDILGARSEAEALAAPQEELLGSEGFQRAKEAVDQARAGQPSVFRYQRLRQGQPQWILSSLIPLKNRDGEVYRLIGVTQDVTEAERTSHELVHIQRMSAANALSAGVSHNLNNILTGILGPVELILRQNQDPAIHESLQLIQRSARRAAALVAEFRRRDPSATLILITGWALPVGDPRIEAFDLHLQKPLHPASTVLATIDRALILRRARLSDAAESRPIVTIPRTSQIRQS